MADAPRPDQNRGGFLEASVSMEESDAAARRVGSKHALYVFDSCFPVALFAAARTGVPDAIAARTALPVREFITACTARQSVPG